MADTDQNYIKYVEKTPGVYSDYGIQISQQ